MTFAEHWCQLRHAGIYVSRCGRLQQTIMINLATNLNCDLSFYLACLKATVTLTFNGDVEGSSHGAGGLCVDAAALVRASVVKQHVLYDQLLAVADSAIESLVQPFAIRRPTDIGGLVALNVGRISSP